MVPMQNAYFLQVILLDVVLGVEVRMAKSSDQSQNVLDVLVPMQLELVRVVLREVDDDMLLQVDGTHSRPSDARSSS